MAPKRNPETEALHFSRPPVRAVSFDLLLDLSEPLSLAHLAGLIEEWQESFPDVVESTPDPSDDESIGVLVSGGRWPLPQIEMKGPDGRSITLASKSLAIGWVFDSESSSTLYPGYLELKRQLGVVFSEFLHHLANRDVVVSITGAACRYVNDIPIYSPKEFVTGYFLGWPSDSVDVALDSPSPSYVGGRIFFEPSEDTQGCTVMLGIDAGSSEPGALAPGASTVLDIRTRLSKSETTPDSTTLEFLDVVHAQLIGAFMTASNETLRKKWGQVQP